MADHMIKVIICHKISHAKTSQHQTSEAREKTEKTQEKNTNSAFKSFYSLFQLDFPAVRDRTKKDGDRGYERRSFGESDSRS
ncbi:hypothetical protein RRG08_051571 [Elysia crispata]|uniref:Uncharacterized protein n=1 Tax=Elysia crispata TaxID=231223 RepID=A0AAE1DFY9_9GAST|nr:hypothetical protein RRG08_051571 [Elysia crispata]